MEYVIIFNNNLLKQRTALFNMLCSLRYNFKRIINYFLIKYQLILRTIKVVGYPYDIFIDPCNICMLHCPLCPTGIGDTSRVKAILSFELFKKIIDEVGDYAYSVTFTNWGEPLLNKHLVEMIKYCKKVKHIPFVRFDTNLNIVLTERSAESLLLSGLDMLSVSIDGVTQETYEKYRKGGDLKKVLNNSRLLIDKRQRFRLEKPYIYMQFLVFRHNIHEIGEAINLAHQMGFDAIRIASARAYTGTDVIKPTRVNYEISKEYLPEPGSKWSHYTSDLKRIGSKKICDWLWKRIVINPDGSVSSCCAYYPQEYDLGNISYESIKSVWNSNKYIMARKIAKNPKKAKFYLQKGKIPCAICIPLGNFIDV